MPYKSKKQQAWAHTEAGTKALGGAAKVHEWDQATKHKPGGFAALPKRVPKRAGDAPGANLAMRGAVAPARFPFLKPMKMAKPRGVRDIIPQAPAGTRTMSRKPFGSFMPTNNAFSGEPYEPGGAQ